MAYPKASPRTPTTACGKHYSTFNQFLLPRTIRLHDRLFVVMCFVVKMYVLYICLIRTMRHFRSDCAEATQRWVVIAAALSGAIGR